MFVRVLASWSKKLYTKTRHKKGLAFDPKKQYRVFEYGHDGKDKGYVILVNEYNEIWWVCNRHVRVVNTETSAPIKPAKTRGKS